MEQINAWKILRVKSRLFPLTLLDTSIDGHEVPIKWQVPQIFLLIARKERLPPIYLPIVINQT